LYSLFWAAYIAVDGTGMPKERVANAKMFEQGARAAIEVSRANLRRVILQCGAKWWALELWTGDFKDRS
jgi:hypothetical protein